MGGGSELPILLGPPWGFKSVSVYLFLLIGNIKGAVFLLRGGCAWANRNLSGSVEVDLVKNTNLRGNLPLSDYIGMYK